MKLYLADEEKLNVYNLPEKVAESFLFSYIPSLTNIEVFLNIYSNEGKWYFKNDDSIKCTSGKDNIAFENYRCYNLKIIGSNYDYYMFTYPINDTFNEFVINDNIEEIKIGNSSESDIIFGSLANSTECTITKEKGLYYINQPNEKGVTYVNRRRITSKTILSVGDIIFIKNVKIIWMKTFIRIYSSIENISLSPKLNNYKEKNKISNKQFLDYDCGENDVPLYKDDNYFFHKPRLTFTYEEEDIVIDPPPGKFVNEEVPFIFTIGASGTMFVMSLISIFNAIKKYDANVGLNSDVIIPVVQAVVMLTCSVLLPKILSIYQKKYREKKEKLRQEKYTKYLEEKQAEISKAIKYQSQTIYDTYLSSFQCYEIAIGEKARLWEREISDKDFLTIRTGLGNKPASLNISAPEERFELDRDNLIQKAIDIKNNSNKLLNVPITFSLLENRISSIICNTSFKDEFIEGIILQLVTMHSPIDLKIVLLTNKENEYKWNAVKLMPHLFSEDKTQRYFATNEDEAKEIFKSLEEVYNERNANIKAQTDENKETNQENPYLDYKPYYIIITDDFGRYKNLAFLDEVIEAKLNLGFSFLMVDKSLKHLPNTCNKYIYVVDKVSCIFEKEYTSQNQLNFSVEYCNGLDMYRAARELSNIPIQSEEASANLPSSISFLEMYNVGNIEQLGILNRWKSSDPITTLSCPIGVHSSGDLFKLDLHEKYHGPHGLIAGSTGSGKSEFIITYILSMAVNYHPDEVQFVLIDYKGGGLAGAFENREKGISIPHLAGTITNLDVSEMNRTLVSINSELKRRQKKFNEARDALGESTIDIYKYQKYYREGLLKEPIPHLLIISDEFAELKSQQPDFMDELISTARIGRSLGVHLILATQKPSGVVNDQIWSNAKFKVCLKVQTKADSNEMLKRPDAASIKEAGRFYLQVGYDELFELGQSAWSGAKYIESEKVVKKVDDSINFINNVGESIKSINNINVNKTTSVDKGEQVTNIVNYLCKLGKENNIQSKKLWLDSIPEKIYISNLIKKYNYKPTPYVLDPIIGEYDNPVEQKQGLLTVDISKKGNLLLFGMPGSGKENLLSTLIVSLCTNHTTDELYTYIIDYGSETLRKFIKFPQVGDVVLSDDNEKLINLTSMLFAELEKRKEMLADYSGSYELYNKSNKKKLPNILCIINGYENFCEQQVNLSEKYTTLYKDGPKFGMYFILSTSLTTGIRLKIQQLFANKISLKLNDPTEYRYLLGAPKGLIPAKYFGRGIACLENGSYEFQTAYISDSDNINLIVKSVSDELSSQLKNKAPRIPILPKFVTPDYIADKNYTLANVPVGMGKSNLSICNYDFKAKNFNVVLATSIKKHINFIYGLAEMINKISMTKLRIIDALKIYNNPNQDIDVFNDDFNTLAKQIKIETNNDGKKPKHNVFFIIGLDEFRSKLDKESLNILDNLLAESKKYTGNTFIIMDSYTSFRSLETTSWLRDIFDGTNGIWLGGNASTQSAIRMPELNLNDKRTSFPQIGYVVNDTSHTIIKYIVDKECNTEDEE